VTPPPALPVAVVILNWNSWPDTLECLESVVRLDYPRLHVVLCDNGSTDGSLEAIAAWVRGALCVLPEADAMAGHSVPPGPRPVTLRTIDRTDAARPDAFAPQGLTLIRNGANLGFAAGNNSGLRHALALGARYVWLLNADTVVAPGALRALVDRAEADPDIGLCGSLLCYYHAPRVIQEAAGCVYHPLVGIARRIAADADVARAPDRARVERRLGYVSAASCLVSARFLAEVGLLSEDYFLYGEEIDWATRGRPGFRLGYAPDSVVYHKKGQTTGSKSIGTARSPASAHYLWRARRRFTGRYYRPLGLPGLFAVGFLAALIEVGRGRGASARAILSGLLDRPDGGSAAGPSGQKGREREAGD
jgi:GT2 family glycosyltransferase